MYIPIVFAVESRQNLICLRHNAELQKYLTGFISAEKPKLIAINHRTDDAAPTELKKFVFDYNSTNIALLRSSEEGASNEVVNNGHHRMSQVQKQTSSGITTIFEALEAEDHF